ncbi:hypothetical protein [Pseudomonas sp. NPDC089534]|uniref:hypothetical protein n=1 Tax=Pseudomonas sp. NPDC089534 TaxID=3364468 RepID=UPI003825DFE4
MLTPTRLLIVLGLLAITAQAQAACETKPFNGHSLSRCKIWPAFANQAISAKSSFVPDADGGQDGVFDLELSVVNASSLKPLVTYVKPGAFNSDAIRFDDLKIDTARYRLATEVRAFGLRSSFGHSSRANPYEKTDLALYVREGDKLRPVLEGLVVYKNSGEWMANCEGEGKTLRRTLEVGPQTHHGFSDLIVTTKGTQLKTVKSGQACVSSTTELAATQITLSYDGRQYTVPEDLRGY